MEQQTLIPQIKDEAAQKPKRAIFPFGGDGGGVQIFHQFCSRL